MKTIPSLLNYSLPRHKEILSFLPLPWLPLPLRRPLLLILLRGPAHPLCFLCYDALGLLVVAHICGPPTTGLLALNFCSLDCCTRGDRVMYDPTRILLSVKETLLLITPGKTTGLNQGFSGQSGTYIGFKLTPVHSPDLK